MFFVQVQKIIGKSVLMFEHKIYLTSFSKGSGPPLSCKKERTQERKTQLSEGKVEECGSIHPKFL